MGKQKSLIKNLSITTAGRRHKCRSDKSRFIHKGESRFEVKEGRNIYRYSLETADKFLETAITELQALSQKVKSKLAEREVQS